MRRQVVVGFSVAAALFALLNVVAYRHAHSMLYFAPSGAKTKSLEKMTAAEKMQVLLNGVNLPHVVNTETPSARGMRFSVEQVPFEQCYLEVWIVPAARSRGRVIMFHGHGGGKASLLSDAALFHDLGFELIIVDFPGYGGSPGEMTTVGFNEAKAVAAVWEWSRERPVQGVTILHGVSMGAAAVMRAISVMKVDPDGTILEAPFDRLANTVRHRFHVMGLPSFPLAELLLFWGSRMAGMDAFAHDPVLYARDIRCPVLLLAGEKDRFVLTAETRAIFDALNDPKSMHLFLGLTHQDLAKASPGEWRSQVAPFVSSLAKASR